MQIAVIRRSDAISDGDLAFMCKAVNDQVYEAAEAWNCAPTPVAFYSRESNLPDDDVRVLSVVDDVAMVGTLGYHDAWAGVISAQVLAQGAYTSVTLSHECLEMMVDPGCNLWRTMLDGKRMTAVEACDAVEADTYLENVEILGEHRQVELSNYLLPAWFEPMGAFPFDRMKKLPAPFTMSKGGYLIVRDDHNNISNVFASGLPQTFARKLANPLSRTHLRGGNAAP